MGSPLPLSHSKDHFHKKKWAAIVNIFLFVRGIEKIACLNQLNVVLVKIYDFEGTGSNFRKITFPKMGYFKTVIQEPKS